MSSNSRYAARITDKGKIEYLQHDRDELRAEVLRLREENRQHMTGTHGGRREGAGRKPKVNHASRQTVYLDQRHVHQISNYQSEHGGTFSAALRRALDLLDSLLKERES